jgi:hypothetical protein
MSIFAKKKQGHLLSANILGGPGADSPRRAGSTTETADV